MENTGLAKLENATRMLGEVRTIDDARDLIDLAEAARVYAKQVKLGLEAQNHAAEIKIRAQRRAGKILDEMDKNKGGWNEHNLMFQPVTSSSPQKYDDLGIARIDAHVWQTIAAIDEAIFEEKISDMRQAGLELSTATLYQEERKELRQEERQTKRNELADAGSRLSPRDRWHIEQGDIRNYQTSKQFDFIITDPPYPKEYLQLYEVLAQRAVEWLRPDGLLVAM